MENISLIIGKVIENGWRSILSCEDTNILKNLGQNGTEVLRFINKEEKSNLEFNALFVAVFSFKLLLLGCQDPDIIEKKVSKRRKQIFSKEKLVTDA